MTVLAENESILYTWDDPTGTRSLMWNVYGGSDKQDAEVDIKKVGRKMTRGVTVAGYITVLRFCVVTGFIIMIYRKIEIPRL